MFESDVSYYRRRADAELEQAQRATRPEAVRVHSELASAYLELISAAEPIKSARHG
jgi:hypothetical protein